MIFQISIRRKEVNAKTANVGLWATVLIGVRFIGSTIVGAQVKS
jgi:hypothetical protein